MEVAQSCSTLCNPMDCSPPGCFVHRILQRTLKWVAICLSRGIFLTQGSNPGVQHCRQILYCLSYQGSASKCLKSLSLNPIWNTSYPQLKPHFFTHAFLCLLQPDLLPAHSTARTFPLSSLRNSKAAKATESFSALSISPLNCLLLCSSIFQITLLSSGHLRL